MIKEIRQQAEHIREAELEKTLNRIVELSPEDHDRIVAMTHSIVNKIMHNPTIRLREKAAQDQTENLTYLVRELFGISNPNLK